MLYLNSKTTLYGFLTWNLTLTNVVFEFDEMNQSIKDVWDLTLTNVVFEWSKRHNLQNRWNI